MKQLFLGATILSALLTISSTASAGMVASESFETNLTPPAIQYSGDQDSFNQGVIGPVDIPNFTFSGYSGIMTNGFAGLFPATTSGTQFAFLQSYHSNDGEIDWSLTGLNPGQEYALSFEVVRPLAFGPAPFSVSAFGVSLISYSGGDVPSGSFATQTLDFTPSTANGSIDFIGGLEGDNSLTAIDNLTVSTMAGVPEPGVPEPATWAMLVLGFAGLGFVGYRRGALARTAA